MSKKEGSVVVEFPGGVREYNSEDHGENFRELAEEFAEKKSGKIFKKN